MGNTRVSCTYEIHRWVCVHVDIREKCTEMPCILHLPGAYVELDIHDCPQAAHYGSCTVAAPPRVGDILDPMVVQLQQAMASQDRP